MSEPYSFTIGPMTDNGKKTNLAKMFDERADLLDQLAARDRELAELKRRFREVHKWRCTADNCTLDGGPEHEEYFSGGGMTFDEELAHETKSLYALARCTPTNKETE